MPEQRVAAIRTRLHEAFAPVALEVIDDSHLHAGHVGAREGKGHFRVTIVSAAFANKRPLERHRMVFDALEDLMRTDIHALSVTATSPEQV
jgi:BolA family transcriptional regulator, general stress-responsive regulator